MAVSIYAAEKTRTPVIHLDDGNVRVRLDNGDYAVLATGDDGLVEVEEYDQATWRPVRRRVDPDRDRPRWGSGWAVEVGVDSQGEPQSCWWRTSWDSSD